MLTNLALDLPLPAPVPIMTNRSPHRHLCPDARKRPVENARAALADMPPEQRVALAIELLRDAADPGCALQLRNAAQVARDTADKLARMAFLDQNTPKDH